MLSFKLISPEENPIGKSGLTPQDSELIGAILDAEQRHNPKGMHDDP